VGGWNVAVVAALLLKESVLRLQFQKCLLRDEVVINAILLARPRAASRVRYGKGEGVGMSLRDCQAPRWYGAEGRQQAYLEEQLVEGSLADARGAGDHDWTRVADCFKVRTDRK